MNHPSNEPITVPHPVDDSTETQHQVCPLCDPDRALCGYDRKSPHYLRRWAEVPATRPRCVVCRDLNDTHFSHIRLWRQLGT